MREKQLPTNTQEVYPMTTTSIATANNHLNSIFLLDIVVHLANPATSTGAQLIEGINRTFGQEATPTALVNLHDHAGIDPDKFGPVF
tara:strand:- start:74 stop:334 length:261 start_codon:yes stop_codon:yes gene_type:complete